MKARLFHLWDTLASSYWFVPTLMLLASTGLAYGMLAADEALELSEGSRWRYGGGIEGARTVLSTVAGSTMTVAGVVFSITIAALTQASSQFGPRLLRNFMRDTGNQVVLGTFVATFLYCILVLREVPGGEDAVVPHLSVVTAVALAVASLCVLVYFIHHVSASIQAPEVVARAWDELRSALGRAYPERLGEGGPGRHGGHAPEPVPASATEVPAAASGYVQAIDVDALLALVTAADVRVEVLCRPGKFVVRGGPIARLAPAEAATDALRDGVARAFLVGRQRTPEQDVEYAIDQMVEIAVRALSPGINDPFTAMNCLDWLAESLCRIARAGETSPYRYDEAGVLRVVTDVSSFEGIVAAAFDAIRQYGRGSAPVTIRLLERIATVAEHVSTDAARAPLRRQAVATWRQSRDALPDAGDRADVEARYRAAMCALGGPPETTG